MLKKIPLYAAVTLIILGALRFGFALAGVPLTTSNLYTSDVAATAMGSQGATVPISCDQQAAINITTAATTQLVAASGTKAVYICGFTVQITGTETAQLEYGSGTTCGTGTTAITGPLFQTFSDGGSLGIMAHTTAGAAVCLLTTGASPSFAGTISYAQF